METDLTAGAKIVALQPGAISSFFRQRKVHGTSACTSSDAAADACVSKQKEKDDLLAKVRRRSLRELGAVVSSILDLPGCTSGQLSPI